MAKELPYFKFEPGQWENGNIQLCDFQSQGVFINVCSIYWQRLGDLSYKFALIKVCRNNDSSLKSLIEHGVLKLNGDQIIIDFLDKQLEEFKLISDKRSEAGRKGGENRILSPELARIKGDQIYVIHCYNEVEEFLKVGVTADSISRRFSGKMPYSYDILLQHSTSDNIDLESYCNEKLYKDFYYRPAKEFTGYLECYRMSVFDELNDIIKQRIGNAIAMPKQRTTIREEEIKIDKKKKEENTPLRAFEIPYVFGSQLYNTWMEWEQFRKEKKQKLTPTTAAKQIQFLGGRGDPEAIEILNQSMKNGWTGLFELKKQNNGIRGFSTATTRGARPEPSGNYEGDNARL